MSWSRRAVRALLLLSLTATATGATQGVRAQLGAATGRTIPIGDYHAAASGEGFTSAWQGRSEEHTSELQSLAYLVCRLLLEKKKKKQVNDLTEIKQQIKQRHFHSRQARYEQRDVVGYRFTNRRSRAYAAL